MPHSTRESLQANGLGLLAKRSHVDARIQSKDCPERRGPRPLTHNHAGAVSQRAVMRQELTGADPTRAPRSNAKHDPSNDSRAPKATLPPH